MSRKDLLHIWYIWIILIILAGFMVYLIWCMEDHIAKMDTLNNTVIELSEEVWTVKDYVIDLQQNGIDVYIK